MRYLLSFLLLFGITFGQKIVTMTETEGDETKIKVRKEIEDDKLTVSITKDGKTEEFTADLDDEEGVAAIEEKLAEYDLEGKVKIQKRIKQEDCEQGFVWYDNGDKDVKHFKMHKPMLLDEKAGYLGVHIQNLTEQLGNHFKLKDGKGVLVSEVVEDSPADKAGLKAGDVITKVDDQKVESTSELTETVRRYEPETKVTVTVVRAGKTKKLNATLGETENSFAYKFGDWDKMGEHRKLLKELPHPTRKDFDVHAFNFDEQELKAEMENMKAELEKLKRELEELKKEN